MVENPRQQWRAPRTAGWRLRARLPKFGRSDRYVVLALALGSILLAGLCVQFVDFAKPKPVSGVVVRKAATPPTGRWARQVRWYAVVRDKNGDFIRVRLSYEQ